jgi:predicted 3-demethylubiquinone-9 3-methyltransferase (glyoxalase superfamily)
MQKITTHLWFDKEAKEAGELYTSLFSALDPGTSQIKSTKMLSNTPSGTVEIVNLELAGQSFTFLSAGPLFRFNPSVSFLVACRTKGEVDLLWKELSVRGTVMMDLGSYPFSERYGWVADRYGLSWQVMYTGGRQVTQRIIPTLMFVGHLCGKAEEAVNFYKSTFRNASIDHFMRYGKGEAPETEGTIRHAGYSIEGVDFAAMDSARGHQFTFNEAISFMVHCETQEEIDYFWEKLSADPKAEACGWLKDRYGLSWQIVPTIMNTMMKSTDGPATARVTEAFLKMKKFDIATLQRAYDGT